MEDANKKGVRPTCGMTVVMKLKSAAALCLFSVCPAANADVAVSNSVRQSVSANTVFTAQTLKQVAFPNEAGTPIFWLDCSDTNGWSFTADGGVLRIPSKVSGSSRYLTSDKNDPNYENFSWKCFGYPNQYAVKESVWVEPPVFTTPETVWPGVVFLISGNKGPEGRSFSICGAQTVRAPHQTSCPISAACSPYMIRPMAAASSSAADLRPDMGGAVPRIV